MPTVSRVRGATIGAPDVDAIENLYTSALGYAVVEKSLVTDTLARSWGAPLAAGCRQVLMCPATQEDVFIRAVETHGLDDYKAMTTWGWNSFEIIVDDVDALHQRLLATDFRHIGGPANLGGGASSIRASQYIGPAGEVIYFNCEMGDRSASNLPDPGDDVGRTNIFILAVPNVGAAMTEYRSTLGIGEGMVFKTPIGVVSEAQGQPADTLLEMGFSRLREPGNAIEFDQYPESTGPRKRVAGHLPQGNAIATFSVDDLDKVSANFITEPHSEYGAHRAATLLGTSGEILELFEEPR